MKKVTKDRYPLFCIITGRLESDICSHIKTYGQKSRSRTPVFRDVDIWHELPEQSPDFVRGIWGYLNFLPPDDSRVSPGAD